jgi:hypothetical protein
MLPVIQKEFGVSRSQVQWVAASNTIVWVRLIPFLAFRRTLSETIRRDRRRLWLEDAVISTEESGHFIVE